MATASANPTFTLKTILQHKAFRTIWLAQLVSIFGDFLALFGVIIYITFSLHGTAVDVTAVTIAWILPFTIIGPVAGVFVDHWNVKAVMIASDLIRAALIVTLVFATDVWHICLILAALTTVSSFFAPAQSVTVRCVVPSEGLLAANAMLSQAFYVVRIISPYAAAALAKLLTVKACYYFDSASFVFSALMISTLVVVRPARADSGDKTLKSLTQDFLAGNKFIFTHASLAFVFMAMALAMFVMSSFSPLISIYIRDGLNAGPGTFGIISAMVGVGLVVGGALVTKLVRTRSKSHVVLVGLLGLGAGTALLGLFKSVVVAGVSTFAMGFAIAFVLVPAQTLSQQETPPSMVGRVTSSFMSLISVSQVLGLLLSGVLAEKLGVRLLFIACAAALAMIAGAGYTMLRAKNPATETAPSA
ncbi:MAG TPA: MFS transporter [Alphaproteobacteria bacterium]|nr:MFS transporter [Alphaproteobacteria bacterium]